ncbi:MAG: GC-type dockerin domain-anchored protein [Planctomycetota bacterium]
MPNTMPVDSPERRPSRSFAGLAAAVLLAAAGSAAAGSAAGQAHEALVISNPASPAALEITNEYVSARGLPPTSVLWIEPKANNFNLLVDVNFQALFGTLANRRIGPSIDNLVLGPSDRYRVGASGLVNDSCFEVNRFGLPGAYALAPFAETIRAGGISVLLENGYATTQDNPIAFDSELSYDNGLPGGSIASGKLFIAASLGYTGERGVDVPTMRTMIERSVAADGRGAPPGSIFYFMETDDPARSGPRENRFPIAVSRLSPYGAAGIVETGSTLPTLSFPALGIMTGDDLFDVSTGAAALEPGAFADHLTSYGADFGRAQQTKISDWIRAGAAGSFGTVEEPCNYPQKFPTAFTHTNYAAGLTLGESVYRSLGAVPFQGYLLGDPLCRPFATGPQVGVEDLPTGPVAGALLVTPTATPTRPGTGIGEISVLVDGVVVASGASGSVVVPTNHLDDGWHELRIVATDDSPQAVAGEWVGSFTLANAGVSATLTPSQTGYNRSTPLTFDVVGSGDEVIERRVIHMGRVIAADDGTGVLETRGEIIGAGPARVWAEVDFADGSTARSEPVELQGTDARPAVSITPVKAFSSTLETAPGEAFAVHLPATFADDLGQVTYSLNGQLGQAALLGGDGPVRIFRADADAAGTDTIGFTVTNGQTTDSGTLTVRYRPVPVPCLADINRDGQATSSDFFAWVSAYSNNEPASDQNGDGQFGAADPEGSADFFAWIVNFGEGCAF